MSLDAEALRALQAPIKAKYREAPDAAVITLKARGTVGEGITCKLETGKAMVEAGLHPATGGSGLELCSGDMLLEALVACAGVTLKAVATALGITLDSAEVFAEGDLDFRGTLGVAKDAPVGFRNIRLRFEVKTEASEEQLASLLKLTERYCVVFQTINTKPQLDVVLSNAGKVG
ncbi:MAG: OsmC family protein [Beijerinckiaceae bacterium]|nr:OsmC family protein [Beijerinckiaceae bacterium]